MWLGVVKSTLPNNSTFLAPKWPLLVLVPFKGPTKSRAPRKVSILCWDHLKSLNWPHLVIWQRRSDNTTLHSTVAIIVISRYLLCPLRPAGRGWPAWAGSAAVLPVPVAGAEAGASIEAPDPRICRSPDPADPAPAVAGSFSTTEGYNYWNRTWFKITQKHKTRVEVPYKAKIDPDSRAQNFSLKYLKLILFFNYLKLFKSLKIFS